MEIISNTPRVFCDALAPDEEKNADLLRRLGEPIAVRQWLAASLEKTIRLQLSPPPRMRAMSALAAPDWTREPLPHDGQEATWRGKS